MVMGGITGLFGFDGFGFAVYTLYPFPVWHYKMTHLGMYGKE